MSIRATSTVSGSISIRTHLWVWWSEIAIDAEREGWEARHRAVADSLGDESRAALVAVAGSAHALDAIYGAVKPLVQNPPYVANRPGAILETLKVAFKISGARGGGRWATEFAWLFNLRDAAVHHEEADYPTHPHPSGVNTGYVSSLYTAESAARAVDLLLDVLDVLTTSPRPETDDWSSRMRNSALALNERRTGARTGAHTGDTDA